jgi:hypothetical protein
MPLGLKIGTKGKVQPITGHEGPNREKRFSCTLPLTSRLNQSVWSMPHPANFNPERDPATTVQRLAQAQRVQKVLPPLGLNPQNVQHVASHYTNHIILIMFIMVIIIIYDNLRCL